MLDRVLYLVGSAAPPVRDFGNLIARLECKGWRVCVFVTPTAASWIDVDALSSQAAFAAKRETSSSLPSPDLVLVCPATFNTVNKWAAGISDNSALGLLNEVFGLQVSTYVMPYAKDTLAAHPAFSESLDKLRSWGVTVLPNELVRPPEKTDPFLWDRLLGALP